jgi:S-adenosylmethionine hydrolase
MFVAQKYGIEEIREIDEAINRRAHTEHSYTFHGRDVYAYTAGKLATGLIKFEEVGPKLINKVVQLHYLSPNYADGIVKGCIWCIDKQFGNV